MTDSERAALEIAVKLHEQYQEGVCIYAADGSHVLHEVPDMVHNGTVTINPDFIAVIRQIIDRHLC